MAMPESSPCQRSSTAAAMDAAALPAAATKARPRGAGGKCAATIFCGSAAATAARKLWRSSSRIGARSGGLERFLARVGAQIEVARIRLGEHASNFVGRHVGIRAAKVQVLHVTPVVLVERMEDRVFPAVKLERLHAKARAHREVERGRRLDPFALEKEVGVAMEDEEVGAHLRR